MRRDRDGVKLIIEEYPVLDILARGTTTLIGPPVLCRRALNEMSHREATLRRCCLVGVSTV
jgi:hypothetical protein